MSSTDRPQSPRLPDRGGVPSPAAGGRDLARSSVDGWPSADEWREQRVRMRAEASAATSEEPSSAATSDKPSPAVAADPEEVDAVAFVGAGTASPEAASAVPGGD